MRKVLAGFIMDGHGGGVDNYLLNFPGKCTVHRRCDRGFAHKRELTKNWKSILSRVSFPAFCDCQSKAS